MWRASAYAASAATRTARARARSSTATATRSCSARDVSARAHALADRGRGIRGVERGAAQLDVLLRGKQRVKRELDVRCELERRRFNSRTRGGDVGVRGGAATRRGHEAEHALDRIDLVL